MPFEELNISLYHQCLNWSYKVLKTTFLSHGVFTGWPVCQMYDSPHSFIIDFMKYYYFLKDKKYVITN